MAIETVVCERNLPRCLVLVRGGECPWKTEGTQWRRWRLPDWSAGVLLAALTAEPVTWDELYLAITRYQPHASWWSCGDDVPEIEAEIVAEEAGGRLWCVVDLVGRTVLASEDFPFPKRDGAYTPEEGELAEGLPVIWCEMSDDWYWELADEDWRERLEQRFQGAADAGPWPDYRAVLYGKSLDEFIASQTICIAQAARQQRGAYADARQVMRSDGPERLACTRRFHAQWLMSPHPLLNRQTPRDVLLEKHQVLMADLDHRTHQWTVQHEPAVGVDVNSFAYRFAGFTTVEIVHYFDLVRHMFDKAWAALEDCRDEEAVVSVLADYLGDVRQQWLTGPLEDRGSSCETAADEISLARQRIPLTASNEPFDCDCPICRAQAEGAFGGGPAFVMNLSWRLDMEGDFAFSLYENFDSWRNDYGDDEPLDHPPRVPIRMVTQPIADDSGSHHAGDVAVTLAFRGNESDPHQGYDDRDSVWQSSFVDWERAESCESRLGFMKLAIGFLLTEMISQLKSQSHYDRTYVDALNDAYSDLNAANDYPVFRTAAAHLRDQLEMVALANRDLVSQSADLQSRLDEMLRLAQ